MLFQRERLRTPCARALMPAPAPLPSLPDALWRRAAVFGPVEVEEPAVPRARLSRRLAILGAGLTLAACRPARARAEVSLHFEAKQAGDAALVAWADELPEVDAALAELFAQAPEAQDDDRIDALSARWWAATDGIRRTPARGRAGLAAKARAVRHLAGQGDIEVATPIGGSLAADVLRLGARA